MRQSVTELTSKGAIEVGTYPGQFVSTLFLVPKKDGRQRPVINLKRLNTFVRTEHFKMEGIHTLQGLLRRGDWMAKIDLQDAYFMVPITGEHRKFLCFCLEGKIFHFNCLPFGLSSAPWVFTKTLKPAMALLRGMGLRLVVYIDDILVLADTPVALREHVLALWYLLENLGFILSQKKCQLAPTQTIEFLGFIVNSRMMELKLPAEKSKKIRLEARKLLEAPQIQARDLSRLIGKMSAAMRGIPPAPLFYRTLQAELAQALAHHDQDYNASLVLTREAKEELQWWIDHLLQWNGKALISPKPTVTITTDASLTGWGATCQESRTGGPWSFLEAQEHINWLELQAAFLGDKILPERQEECVSAPAVGQHHCSSVHQQPGRDSIPSPNAASTEAVDVVTGARHLLDSSTPAGCTEHSSRLGVSSDERQDRLATESNHFSTDKSKVRSTRSRPLCLQADSTPTKVLQLATGSPGRGDRCISPRLEPYPGVCQPTMVPARPSPGSCAHPTGTSHTDSPSMEDPALVPGPPQHVSLHAPADSEAATGGVPGGTQAKPCGGKATTSRVAYLRDRFRDKSLSERSSALLLASWRTKTSRSYDLLFQKWVSWCSERSTDPISGPVSYVVNFLSDLYAQGYQYRSLNSYRSAISSVHDQVDGCPVGQHPLVSQVLKGVFNSRPPLPRYFGTWDVQVVLTFIEGLGPSRDLSLRDLSLKLAMLLALTRPSRSADLCQLKVTRRRYTPDGVIFAPAELAKQSRPGRVLVNFFFPSFRNNELLCPVHTLRVYEDVISLFRSDQKPGLFLATIKPHNPVTSSTIARWLRTVMERAGVDTSVFKAHSVRGASTSAAANVGATIQDILNAADWRTESVFKRFYHRSTGLSTFGTAVLKSKASKDTVDM